MTNSNLKTLPNQVGSTRPHFGSSSHAQCLSPQSDDYKSGIWMCSVRVRLQLGWVGPDPTWMVGLWQSLTRWVALALKIARQLMLGWHGQRFRTPSRSNLMKTYNRLILIIALTGNCKGMEILGFREVRVSFSYWCTCTNVPTVQSCEFVSSLVCRPIENMV